MIRHYDMHTGEPIDTDDASRCANEYAQFAEPRAARLMTIEEAIAEEHRRRSAQPAVVMLPIHALLAKYR
jgi:hypothetical protein